MSLRGLAEIWQREVLGAVQPIVVAASGATLTVTPLANEIMVATLTAACTVASPGPGRAVGDSVFLVLIQDATAGRAVAFNAIFRNAPSIAGGAATSGQRWSGEFRYDGVAWQFAGGGTAFV
jgi:hypothetical protein